MGCIASLFSSSSRQSFLLLPQLTTNSCPLPFLFLLLSTLPSFQSAGITCNEDFLPVEPESHRDLYTEKFPTGVKVDPKRFTKAEVSRRTKREQNIEVIICSFPSLPFLSLNAFPCTNSYYLSLPPSPFSSFLFFPPLPFSPPLPSAPLPLCRTN